MNTISLCFLVFGAAVCSAYEHEHHEPGHPIPYKFEYGVHDPHTKDIKEQQEHGDGHGNVQGYYKLKEADGTERIVHYTADKHLGFVAHVTKVGHAYHPEEYHHEPVHHYEPKQEIHHYEPAHYDNHHHHPHAEEYKVKVYHDKHHATSHQQVSLKN